MNHHELEDIPAAKTSLNDDFGEPPPTRVRYQVLAAACSLAVITYIHRVGFGTAAAELKAPLGLSDTQISWLMFAFMVGYGLFEMPWGFLGDRVGVRNILGAIILGGSLTTAGLALVGLLPSGPVLVFAALLVLRFLFGAIQAGTFPVISRVMADWMPTTERGSAQGTVWMSSRLGGFIAPPLIVWLFGVIGDWKSALVVVASPGLLWCLAFWPWFRNQPEDMPQVNKQERKLIEAGLGARAAHGHGPVPWAKMARSPSVWALCGMYGFLGFSGNFYLTLLPTYLKNHRNLDSSTMSWLSGLPFAFGVLACFAGGWFSDAVIRRWGKRWGRRIVGGTGLMLAALAIVSVPWVDHVVLLGFLLILTFVGNDLAMAPAWASAADIGERYTGVLSGAMNMMASFMAAIQALVIGHLFEMNNLVAPFIILAASYALGTLCWIGVDVRKTLAEAD